MTQSPAKKVLFALFCFLSLALSAEELPSGSFPLGHAVYAELRQLLRANGQPLYSWALPFDANEILNILMAIPEENLDDASLALYDRIAGRLRGQGGDAPSDTAGRRSRTGPWLFREGPLSFAADPVFSLQGRFRASQTANWGESQTNGWGDFRNEAPLLGLPMEVDFAGNLQLVLDADIRNSPAAYDQAPGPLASNLILAPTDVDLSIPYRAFIASGGPWWSFRLGRDQISYGLGHSGNLAISANPDYYDFARLSLFSPSLRLTSLISQLPLDLSILDTASSYLRQGDKPPLSGNEFNIHRFLYYTRLDMRLFKKIGLSMGQGALVGDSPLELRYLNPAIIHHSQWAWNNYPRKAGDLVGSLMTLDIDVALPLGLGLYGQFTMNEFTTKTERELYHNDSTPDSIGFLAGLEWAGFVGTRPASLAFEFLWGSPYYYLLSSPFSSFIWMNRRSELAPGGKRDQHVAWLGHRDARDCLAFYLMGKLEDESRAYSANLAWKLRGEHADLVYDYVKSVAAANAATPSGAVEQELSCSVGLNWRLFSKLSAGGTAAMGLVFSSIDEYSPCLEGKVSLYISYLVLK